MRFTLALFTPAPNQRLTLNYQYPLSAAIYKILNQADEAYAAFLHEQGYRHGGKTFKLFTFSDLRTAFEIRGDRLVMKTKTASLTICFHVPDAAAHFIRGLFMNQLLEVADSRDKASFTVQQVVAESMHQPTNGSVILQPMSPVVVGSKNERGNYDYLSPDAPDYVPLVVGNLIEKYAAANSLGQTEVEELKKAVALKAVYFNNPPRTRLLTFKAGTPAETKVRGYDKFRIQLEAPEAIIAMALDAGIGMHNAMGMGCVQVVRL